MKPRGKRSDVRQFNTLSTDESDSEYEIMAVETDDVNVNMIQNKIFARMLVIDENKEVKFQLDSGATANLIPRSYLIHSQIESENDKLTMYTMKSYGTCMLRVKNPKTHKRYKVKFIVVDDKYTPLLAEGVKPDHEKIAAIVNMEKPTNVKGVQRLLGMINYLTKFLENLSDISEPIRKLTHKENAWNWTFEHDKAFEMIKKAVTKTPVLKYFDSKSETTLQCDASEKGLGASLMQDSQPIAYASRALTKTEQNYAQIEKELLAVVFGMEKFHQYTYGRKVYMD
ncbi:unnamed protein product [Mytilus coruscus]|uniref:Reverse transcriptase/retrotransposon-derived protein RNase H-like domain-containing protein n=1 Tax=Mytilus coruscus TaxID=42192 RepID=A0A6J8CP05_MYTCO|nr:unnamed protein product [Mytilus coruscus]